MKNLAKKLLSLAMAAFLLLTMLPATGAVADTATGITATKTAEWTGTDTVQIAVEESKGDGQETPTILYLGTLCSSHSLEYNTVVQSLVATAKYGNVHYELYAVSNDLTSTVKSKSGTIAMNSDETAVKNEISAVQGYMAAGMHSALYKFADVLEHATFDTPTGSQVKYDYIVMEFDGFRMGHFYDSKLSSTQKATNATKLNNAAEVLKDYYAADKVAWIIPGTLHTETECHPYDYTNQKSTISTTSTSSHTDTFLYNDIVLDYDVGTDTCWRTNSRLMIKLLAPEDLDSDGNVPNVPYLVNGHINEEYFPHLKARLDGVENKEGIWVHYDNPEDVFSFLKERLGRCFLQISDTVTADLAVTDYHGEYKALDSDGNPTGDWIQINDTSKCSLTRTDNADGSTTIDATFNMNNIYGSTYVPTSKNAVRLVIDCSVITDLTDEDCPFTEANNYTIPTNVDNPTVISTDGPSITELEAPEEPTVSLLSVTYHFTGDVPNGASLPSPNPDYVQPSTAYTSQSPTAPDGYVFSGWYTGSDYKETDKYTDGTKITDSIDLYGKWTPALSVEKDAKVDGTSVKGSEVHGGDKVTYSVIVKNTSSAAISNIAMTDAVPTGIGQSDISAISNSGTFNSTDNTITWSGLTVPAATSATNPGVLTLTYDVTVPTTITAETSYTNTAYITKIGENVYEGPGSKDNDPGTATVTGEPVSDVKITTKLNDTDTDIADITGDTALYLKDQDGNYYPLTQSATDPEEWTAENVPYGDYTIVNGNTGTPTQIDTLTVSETSNEKTLEWINVEYHFVGDTPEDASTLLPETATIRKDTAYTAAAAPSETGYTFDGWFNTEDCTTGDKYTDGTTLSAKKDLYGKWSLNTPLSVEKSVKAGATDAKDTKQLAGTTLTYTITVKNNNTAAAMPVEMEDAVPASLTNVTGISNGGTYNETTRTITWTGLSVPKATSDTNPGTLTLSYSATISADITAETELTNKAYITKANGKEYTGPGSKDNNPGEVTVTGEPVAEAKVYTKLDGVDTPLASITGGTTLYLKDGDGNYYPLTQTEDTPNEWKKTVPYGTYTIVSKDDGTGDEYGTLTVSDTANTATVEWVSVSYHFVNAPSGVESLLPETENVLKMSQYTAASTASIEKTGFTFSGWYNTEAGETKYIDGTTLTAHKDLYGLWESNSDLAVKKNITVKDETASIADTKQNAGTVVTYTVTVENNHAEAVTVVDLEDNVPAGLTDISNITGGGTYSETTRKITWSTVSLAAKSSVTLTYDATIPGDITFETDYTNKAFITKANGKTYTGPGSENNNPGTVKVTGVPKVTVKTVKEWSDTWENHTDVYVNVYANDTTVAASAVLDKTMQSAEWKLPALDDSGKTITYTVYEMTSGTVDAKKLTEGTVTDDHYKVTYVKDAATGTTTIKNDYVIQPEDLDFGKTADATAEAGGTFTYTLTVKNTRTYETAKNVVVEDILPDGLTLNGSNKSADDTLVQDGTNKQKYTWTIASIAPGETATLKLIVKVPADATAVEYINKAQIKSIDDTALPTPKDSPEAKTTVRSFTVKKLWLGTDGKEIADLSKMPSVIVNLLQNGAQYDTVTLRKDNNWQYKWNKLPLYDEEGTAYTYTVSEPSVPGYTTTIEYKADAKSATYGDTAADVKNTLQALTVSYQFVGTDIPQGVSEPASENPAYGTAYNAAEKPSAKNYSFEGWYTDEDCTVPYTDGTVLDNSIKSIEESKLFVLYGKWTHENITVKVVPPTEGPDVEYPDSWTVPKGEKADPTELTDPTGEYTFEGYYWDPDFNEPADPDTLFNNPELTDDNVPGGELELYPKWTKNVVVTYEFVGKPKSKAVLPDPETVEPGTKFDPNMNVGDVSRYRFDGWYTDEALTKPFVPGTVVEENITLYGKFVWIPPATGDTSNPVLWSIAAACSLAAAAAVIFLGKRKHSK